jgi:hypothetical protein
MPDHNKFWVRAGLYGESLREAGLLLAIFGPIASFEVIRALRLKLALAMWSVAAVMLILGVEAEVAATRRRRRGSATILLGASEQED